MTSRIASVVTCFWSGTVRQTNRVHREFSATASERRGCSTKFRQIQILTPLIMPVLTTYPGVYIEEIPSGVHTITGVATSITAFLGKALRGKTDEPVTITSFA